MPVSPLDTNEIVITASRAPEQEADTPASVTIIDATRVERLDEPLARALIRLVPSASVSSSACLSARNGSSSGAGTRKR